MDYYVMKANVESNIFRLLSSERESESDDNT